MKNYWTEGELKAYVLIYAMNADRKETSEEIEIIENYVNPKEFNKMYNEFCNDHHYQSIQKISNAIRNLNYSENQIQNLFYEIKEVFDADRDFSIVERNLTIGLKRILNF